MKKTVSLFARNYDGDRLVRAGIPGAVVVAVVDQLMNEGA